MNLTEKEECDIIGGIKEKKENLLLKDTTAEKISGIYKIVNKVNGKYYVGSSKNIHKRWGEHRSTLNKNNHKNDYLQRSWNKYGINSFGFIITEKIVFDKLVEIEQKYLDIAKQERDKCYNLSFDAGRVEFTEEVRKKLSDSHKGHKMTLENKLILMKLTKERVFTKEYRKKISDGTKLHTPRGINHHHYNHTIYTFKNINTNDIFTGTFLELRTKYNLSHGNLSNMIVGKRKSVRGWTLSI